MHLNLTLSAPGGPGSSWGDRENPKPLGVGGSEGGPSPGLSSLRFAAAFLGPCRESPLGQWSQGFWKLVEEGRREAGLCCSDKDRKAVSSPAAWTLVQFLHWVLLASALGEKSNALSLRGDTGLVLYCRLLPSWLSLSGSPKCKFLEGRGSFG